MKIGSMVLLHLLATTPAGAAPEVYTDFPTLESLDSLRSHFNSEAGQVRLVALLAPSCGYCVKGYRYMARLLEEIDDPRLSMSVVWLPMLSGDTERLASRLARRYEDPRLTFHAWDPERRSGEAWRQRLGLESTAWDVYFLYGGDAHWEEVLPPAPDYWQHQGAGGGDWLDYGKLKTRILQALTGAERERR